MAEMQVTLGELAFWFETIFNLQKTVTCLELGAKFWRQDFTRPEAEWNRYANTT